MRSRTERQVLWPAYFDIRLSRDEGRMVPKSLAVTEPTCDDILKAVQKSGFSGEIEADKAYPREWYVTRGRVVVGKSEKKGELVKRVASEMKKARVSAQQPKTQ